MVGRMSALIPASDATPHPFLALLRDLDVRVLWTGLALSANAASFLASAAAVTAMGARLDAAPVRQRVPPRPLFGAGWARVPPRQPLCRVPGPWA